MDHDHVTPDAEAIFIPQLLFDLIQRLVERNVLATDDARELIEYSLTKSAECNPAHSVKIHALKPFCERFSVARIQA